MRLFSPDKQERYSCELVRCFRGKAPSITRVKLAYGERVAESWLEIQLFDLSEYSGCKGKLTNQHIEAIARVIISQYYYLKVTELMYFFHLFKAGKFGYFYGNVDGLVITNALNKFLEIRVELLNKIEKEEQQKKRDESHARAEQNALTREEYEEIEWLFKM